MTLPSPAAPLAEPAPGAPVVVGLSGGVDSAVSALLLQERGFAVRGLFMKNWEEDDRAGFCASAEDLADAQAVCDHLRIPLDTVNFSTEYWDRVFCRFLEELAAGRTPNPDVLCNREIKFRAFFDHANRLGDVHVATGHYARNLRTSHGFLLQKGIDPAKDQSYFLYTLGQSTLEKTLFPLGELEKTQVRNLARTAGLPVSEKKDSTGICFIGERPFRDFLSRYIQPRPGTIESPQGEVLGRHQGLPYYTLGQRQGLGIGGRRGGGGEPWFVAAKDLERNVLVAVQGHTHPRLYHRALVAHELTWVAGTPPDFPLQCQAKIRYRQPDQACQVCEADPGECRVLFHAPQWAMAPGQSVVFYGNGTCLGGGVIRAAAEPLSP